MIVEANIRLMVNSKNIDEVIDTICFSLEDNNIHIKRFEALVNDQLVVLRKNDLN